MGRGASLQVRTTLLIYGYQNGDFSLTFYPEGENFLKIMYLTNYDIIFTAAIIITIKIIG